MTKYKGLLNEVIVGRVSNYRRKIIFLERGKALYETCWEWRIIQTSFYKQIKPFIEKKEIKNTKGIQEERRRAHQKKVKLTQKWALIKENKTYSIITKVLKDQSSKKEMKPDTEPHLLLRCFNLLKFYYSSKPKSSTTSHKPQWATKNAPRQERTGEGVS